jgi:hypothetical protein
MISAVRAVAAIKRIDREQYPETVTFFSEKDQWIFNAVSDIRVCELCLSFEDIGIFSGDLLRTFFPYLEIVDVDEIEANVHPNCRCMLKRIINPL